MACLGRNMAAGMPQGRAMALAAVADG